MTNNAKADAGRSERRGFPSPPVALLYPPENMR